MPRPKANPKKSIEQVARIAQNEGIGYAVLYYMDEGDIADPSLAKLWAQARKAMQALDEALAPYC